MTLTQTSWREFRRTWQAATAKERKRILEGLSEREKRDINWWLVDLARDKQLPPEGDWFGVLIRSGRGFGKTRAGAEWVIERAKQELSPIALIGQTKADVRDTMVELGEASILKVSRPWFYPNYEPSKRRLTWPNGAIAIIYSGDEPGQLRGPQHASAWVDELCFVAGTMIETARGAVPIENIMPGDLVWTRRGLRPVLASEKTRKQAGVFRLETDDGRTLEGTGDHPVWIDGMGFVPLALLPRSGILRICVRKQTPSEWLDGVEGDGSLLSKDTTKAGEGVSCIGASTASTTAVFQRIKKFITKTTTSLITRLTTLLPLHVPNILSATVREDGLQVSTKKNGWRVFRGGQKLGLTFLERALCVARNSWRRLLGPCTVRMLVTRKRKGTEEGTKSRRFELHQTYIRVHLRQGRRNDYQNQN